MITTAQRIALLSCCSLFLATAHVTFSPDNGAAAGGFFFTEVRVPHAVDTLYTSKLEIEIPEGVVSVTPEKLHGWSIDITMGDVTPFETHHGTSTTAPVKITYEAEAAEHTLHDDHLLRIGLSMRLSCDIPDSDYASVFNGNPTLWFPTEQHLANESSTEEVQTLSWTGVGEGDGMWHALTPYPAPFVLVTSPGSCESATFLSAEIPPADVTATQEWVQAQLSALETVLDAQIAELARIDEINEECLEDDDHAEVERRRLSHGCISESSSSSSGSDDSMAYGLGLGLGLGGGLIIGAALAWHVQSNSKKSTFSALEKAELEA